MPATCTNHFRESLLKKYKKRVFRLRKANREGTFSRYSADKKRMLLLLLSKYERQLTHWGIVFAAGAALLLPIHPVQAQTPLPVGGEFQVNTYTTSSQRSPSVAMDSDGDFVVTWHSSNQDGFGLGVYAQRYDNTGTPRGTEFRVNTWTLGYQSAPSITIDNDDEFVVVWQSNNFGEAILTFMPNAIPFRHYYPLSSFTSPDR